MPELPEVEIVVRGLQATIVDRTIARVTVKAPTSSILVANSLKPRRFEQILKGKRILSVNRRGKNILISLSAELTLWVHLKMTGRLLYMPSDEHRDKHDLVVIDFISNHDNNPKMHLRFNDYRRFGRLRLFPDAELWQQNGLSELGPEPLEISAKHFVALCFKRSRMIKLALLDQSFIAGLGNIYADEALHYSRIHPRRLTSSISKRKLIELHGHIRRLLRRSIRLKGTHTNAYVGVDGRPGRFQNYLKVYGREGEPCTFCGTRIVRKRIGSRSAHFCPRCQRDI